MMSWFYIILTTIALSACSLLFPDRSAPKSDSYTILKLDPPWTPVATGENQDSIDALKADLAYENTETGGIISLNSLCRKYSGSSLDDLTSNLVRGIGSLKTLEQKDTTVGGIPAKDTVFEGVVDGIKVNLHTIVLMKKSCTYDFIYVVVPKKDNNNGSDFDKFVASFKAD